MKTYLFVKITVMHDNRQHLDEIYVVAIDSTDISNAV